MSISTEEFVELYPIVSNKELAKQFNIKVQSIKNRAHKLGLRKSAILTSDHKKGGVQMKKKTDKVEEKRTFQDDRKHLKKEENFRTTVNNYKEALKYIEKLEIEVQAIKQLGASKKRHIITPKKSGSTDEATAVACLTDVHIGETFNRDQVNGLNEYSVAIAKQRLDEYFVNVVKLTDKERQGVTIKELVLFLGGDIIDGSLHLDTIMSDEVSEPMKQAVLAQSFIRSGLKYLESHFDKITVICKDGNHGRITQRMHHASRQGNSLEWYMYHNLALEFPQFTWVNEHSLHTYFTFYPNCKGERIVRFHHGDTISFGGVNGPYTYLNRRRYQWNAGNRAHIDVIGHLHMYRVNPSGFILNGSVVGYNPFAISLGAEYERPSQSFFLMDKDKGMTVNIPILFKV
jgi:hypothetical protein